MVYPNNIRHLRHSHNTIKKNKSYSLQMTKSHKKVIKSNLNIYPILEESFQDMCHNTGLDINNNQNDSNLIGNFIREFAIFQYENNIGIISETMDPKQWIEVDSFIYWYIYKMACENKIKNIIYEFGITKGFLKLFQFYMHDIYNGVLQNDSEVLEFIRYQCNFDTNSDMALAILRETVGLSAFKI